MKYTEKRTDQQNKALHVFFRLFAEEMQRRGMSIKMALKILEKYDAPVTEYITKEIIWKPIQKDLYGKNSTTELLKQQEIDQIYDVLVKAFGENGIELPEFPSIENEKT